MGLAGMVQTARNLAQLKVRAGRAEAVFAGEAAQFRLFLDNSALHDWPEVLLRQLAPRAKGATTPIAGRVVDVAAASATEAVLAVPTAHRGWLPLERVLLETRFPLGLFRAWSYVEPDSRCLVYPRPEVSTLPALAPTDQQGGVRAHAQGTDDFSGLRSYQPSDAPRHVAWKSVAKTDVMRTKQFAGEAVVELWLRLEDTPAALDLERRLSRLAGWVLAAERSGARYGLILPGRTLEANSGEAHRAACLEALALHE